VALNTTGGPFPLPARSVAPASMASGFTSLPCSANLCFLSIDDDSHKSSTSSNLTGLDAQIASITW
jgi:hypothetical protein